MDRKGKGKGHIFYRGVSYEDEPELQTIRPQHHPSRPKARVSDNFDQATFTKPDVNRPDIIHTSNLPNQVASQHYYASLTQQNADASTSIQPLDSANQHSPSHSPMSYTKLPGYPYQSTQLSIKGISNTESCTQQQNSSTINPLLQPLLPPSNNVVPGQVSVHVNEYDSTWAQANVDISKHQDSQHEYSSINDVNGHTKSSWWPSRPKQWQKQQQQSQQQQQQQQQSRLAFYHELPRVLQFNPYVNSGYRAGYTYCQCICSLAQQHNEFGNIWTHLAPILCIIGALVSGYWQPWQEFPLGFAATLGSITLCMTCSVMYHTFMARHQHYEFWISCDVVGIFVLFMAAQYWITLWSYPCNPNIRLAITLLYYGIGIIAVAAALLAPTLILRLAPMGIIAGMRFGLYTIRAVQGLGNSKATLFYLLTELIAVLAGLVNYLKIPERYFPVRHLHHKGPFDTWFNSHNIMHFLVLGCFTCLMVGTTIDEMHFVQHRPPCYFVQGDARVNT